MPFLPLPVWPAAGVRARSVVVRAASGSLRRACAPAGLSSLMRRVGWLCRRLCLLKWRIGWGPGFAWELVFLVAGQPAQSERGRVKFLQDVSWSPVLCFRGFEFFGVPAAEQVSRGLGKWSVGVQAGAPPTEDCPRAANSGYICAREQSTMGSR